VSHLRDLAGKIAAAESEHGLMALVIDGSPTLFAASCVAIFMFDDRAATPRVEATGTSAAFLDHYERDLRPGDPLLHCVMQHHRALHDLDVASRDCWLASPLYAQIAAPFGMTRCMQGPIVGHGKVTGTINVARRDDAAFSAEDVMALSSLGAHVSVQVARLRSMPLALDRLRALLTKREVEISLLVAKGLTNEQIGHVLGVSANAIKGTLGRAFRKLGIESRVELVATLFDAL
jgi:DNA-binding CsgD family transcriptional regulator